MTSESDTQNDWFDWAESCLADWKSRDFAWHESFSPRAEQVLQLATQAAFSLNHDAVGAEHLLAGMLKLKFGTAATALKHAGITLPLLREEIESARGVGRQKKVGQPIPYTPRCKGIIQRAQARARALGNTRIEVEDLLLELLAEQEGLPAQIFRKQAIDVEKIKSTITTETRHQ